MAEDDIVQRVKIVVEDVSFDKAIGDATKKLETGLQKSVSAYSPTVKVNFSDLGKFNKAINATAKSADTTTKTIDGVTTALSAMNAVGTAAVTKQLANAGTATKNLVTHTKQAVTEQKNLNKAITASVALPPSERDPNTGRMLPRGVSAPPKRGTPEAAGFDEAAHKKQLAEARAAKREAARAASEAARAAPATPFVPLERDPVTKRYLPRGVKAAAPQPSSTNVFQQAIDDGIKKRNAEAAAAINKTTAATKQAAIAQKDLNKTIAAAPESDRFKPEPRPLSVYTPEPIEPSKLTTSPLQPQKPPKAAPPPPPGGPPDDPNDPRRKRLDALTKRFHAAVDKDFAGIQKDLEEKAAKAFSLLDRVSKDTGSPQEIKARYKTELDELNAHVKRVRAIEEANDKRKKSSIAGTAEYQKESDERQFKAFKERNLGLGREEFEAAKVRAKQLSETLKAQREPTIEEHIDTLRKSRGRTPIYDDRPPPPPGPMQGPDLSGDLRRKAAEQAKKDQKKAQEDQQQRDLESHKIQTDSLKRSNQLKEQLRKQELKEGMAGPQGPDLSGKLREQARRERERRDRGGPNIFGAGASGSFDSLKDAMNSLRPAMLAAGLSFSQLTPYMVAAQAGVVGLTAALAGGLIVALENAGNAAEKAAKRLGNVMGDTDQGKKAYEGLRKIASDLNSTAPDLAKPFEQIINLNRKQKLGLELPDMQELLSTMMKGLTAEDVPVGEAQKAITDLMAEIAELGKVSEGTVKKFSTLAPKFTDTILKGAEKIEPGAVAGGDIAAKTFIGAVRAPETQKQAGVDFTAAQARSKDISTAFSNLTTAAQNLMESLSGGHVIADALDGMANLLKELQKKIDELNLSANQKAGIGGGALGGAIAGAILGFLSPTPGGLLIGGGLGALAGATTMGAVATGAEKVGLVEPPQRIIPPMPPASPATADLAALAPGIDETLTQIQKLGVSADGAAKPIDHLGEAAKKLASSQADISLERARQAKDNLPKEQAFDRRRRELSLEGARIAKEQAARTLKFLPQEQALQSAGNRLAIDQADLAITSAQIGIKEAQKQQALAALAPQKAELDLKGAQLTLDQLIGQRQLKRFEREGRDMEPGADPDVDRVRAQLRAAADAQEDLAIEQAKYAVEVARINATFAHLEPEKAKLAGEQAEQALRSAKLQKASAELRFAKDSSGETIDRDLANLQYQEAELRYAEADFEIQKKQLEELLNIKQALQNFLEALKKADEARKAAGLPTEEKKAAEEKKAGEKTTEIKTEQEKAKVAAAAEAAKTTTERVLQKQEPPTTEKQAADKAKLEQEFMRKTPLELQAERDRLLNITERKEDTRTGGKEVFRTDPRTGERIDATISDARLQNRQQAERERLHQEELARKAAEPSVTPPPPPVTPPPPVVPPPPVAPDTGAASQSISSLSSAADTAKTSLEGIGTSTEAAKTALDGVGTSTEAAKTALDGVGTSTEAAKTALDGIGTSTETAKTALDGIGSSADSAKTGLDGTGQAAGSAATGLNGAATAANTLATAAQSAASALASVKAPAGKASGGMIHGPGTGTSDSILARLSHGEFVMRAAAVRHYGPGLMHALNNFNFPRFNMGGLMSPRMPRFADGGMVGAGDTKAAAPPHLGTVDLRTDHGSAQVMASSAAATQLQKLAVQKRITSTGRKPGFIG